MSKPLAQIVKERRAITVPGAANAMFARVIESLGFECVYLSGAGVANMRLGVPDIGLVSVSEMVDTLASVADAVSIPIIADADTGYGNALNTYRTVRQFERAGAAGIQLEDQVFPKKCGHFAGKDVIPADEMVQKIKAAVDARCDQSVQIIARTDALVIEGIDAALDRARAYAEAGADITFVEAPTSFDDMGRICAEISVPQVANIVFGGKTPDPGQKRLAEMGFALGLYANASLQAALRGSVDVLTSLRDTGSLDSVADRLASFEERQTAVGKPCWDEMERLYRA